MEIDKSEKMKNLEKCANEDHLFFVNYIKMTNGETHWNGSLICENCRRVVDKYNAILEKGVLDV